MECLSDDFLGALLSRQLSAAELGQVEDHLASCEDCTTLVAQLARESAFVSQRAEVVSPALARPPVDELAVGDAIGRYIIIRKLGEGGMGAVFHAYDPQLDRPVAIKVLTVAGDRVLASEAKALARLTHPGIVAVYEIGEHDGALFIVMELVDGLELGVHWRRHVETWRDGVRLLLAAAAGLAEAHRVGLIHRDVSPRNILVDSAGNAKLGDFGLAVSPGHVPRGLVGTPGFIAPEQRDGEAADARADQFALCATFSSLFAMLSSAPGWLRAILERGQRVDPAERFESCEQLASAISRRQRRPRRLVMASGVIALATVAGLAVATRSPPSHRCDGGAAEMRATLGDSLGQIRFAKQGAYGAETATRVKAELESFAGRWSQARRAVCEATHRDGGQSERLLEVRSDCLAVRRRQAGALAALFASDDNVSVDRAIAAVLQLPEPEACLGASESVAWPRPARGTAARAAFETAEATLAEASALLDAGRVVRASALARSVIDSGIEHPQLLARARFVLGGSYDAPDADLVKIREDLERAIEDGARAQDDRLVAEIWSRLLFVTGDRAGLATEALALEAFARAAVRRAGDAKDLGALLASTIAMVLLRNGEYARSASEYRAAITLAESDRQVRARAEVGLCQALTAGGAFEEAREPCARGLETFESLLPSSHASVVGARFAVAGVDTELGRLDEARAQMKAGIEAFRRRYGPRHARVATVLKNLAVLEERAGNHEVAETILSEVVSIRREVLGPDHPRLAAALQSIGAMQVELGKLEAARVSLGEALGIARRVHPPFHPEIGLTLTDLGDLERAAGNLSVAHELLSEAIELYARESQPLPDIVTSLAVRAQVLEAQGKPAAALADLERAVAVSGLQPETVEELESRRAALKKRQKR